MDPANANVIAGQAILEGTIRTQETEVRDYFQAAIRRVAESAGKLHQADVKSPLSLLISFSCTCPSAEVCGPNRAARRGRL